MNAWIIFILLVVLMLTGMPISIALGLTVLGFLFFMTDLPAELVSQRLFTGLDQFAIMAIPFFILAGTFLTHGGVARRMIRFATALVGHEGAFIVDSEGSLMAASGVAIYDLVTVCIMAASPQQADISRSD